MIKIKEEDIQKEYGFSYGCMSCDTNKIENNIKEIEFIPRYGGRSRKILLCQKCREKLKQLLLKKYGVIGGNEDEISKMH